MEVGMLLDVAAIILVRFVSSVPLLAFQDCVQLNQYTLKDEIGKVNVPGALPPLYLTPWRASVELGREGPWRQGWWDERVLSLIVGYVRVWKEFREACTKGYCLCLVLKSSERENKGSKDAS